MIAIDNYTVTKSSNTVISYFENWDEIISFFDEKYSVVVYVVDDKLKDIRSVSELKNVIYVSTGETLKTFRGVEGLISSLYPFQLDRTSTIIAVGGGSLSDVVGFVASIYLRGISFSSIPSTLLSIVDASIGGKNGINFQDVKNQIGTIYQPDYIIHYPPFILSLPDAELSDGFAEIIKYSMIGNRALFDLINQTNFMSFRENVDIYQDIVHRCIIQKFSVIKEDPFEKGRRKILNYGHSFGHAIESLYGLSHGKSVGLGMIIAANMSEIYYQKKNHFVDQTKQLLVKYQLPTSIENWDSLEVFGKIQRDKKKKGAKMEFILIDEIGHARIESIPFSDLWDYTEKIHSERWI